MKIIRTIGLALLAIILLLVIVSFFLPNKMHVEKTITIKAEAQIVYDQINTLKNWEKWSPWTKMDTAMQITYNGPASGKDASYSWVGDPKKTGSGTLTISECKANELVLTKLDFPGDEHAIGGFKMNYADSSTTINWYMDMELGANPMMKYMGIMMKGVMENIFDKGLNDLKKIAESMPPSVKKTEIKSEATTINDIHYLSIRDTATMDDISQKMGTAYEKIGAQMKKEGLQMAGAPFAIYYSAPPQLILDIALNVDKPGKGTGIIKSGMLKAGNVVVTHYFGSYNNLSEGYAAAKTWITSNNKKITGNPWEVYMTDPMMEKDTAKWQTDIYFPVE